MISRLRQPTASQPLVSEEAKRRAEMHLECRADAGTIILGVHVVGFAASIPPTLLYGCNVWLIRLNCLCESEKTARAGAWLIQAVGVAISSETANPESNTCTKVVELKM